MAATDERRRARAIHPLHAALLAGTVPLFLGGLLSDLAYRSTTEIQWNNFAAWLIAGAMVFAGFGLLWALIALIVARSLRTWPFFCSILLLAAFVLGLVDSFVHARDAWGVMPDGPVLSAIVTILAVAATWAGFASLRAGERP